LILILFEKFIQFVTVIMGFIKWRFDFSLLLALSLLVFGCHSGNRQSKRFKLLEASYTGIEFSNDLNETVDMNIITYPDFYSGGGVSIGDIDNDGLSDIFFVGNQQPCRLYRNTGNMKFEDITKQAGLDNMGRGWYTGTCMVDINADGYLDIYVSKSGMEVPEDRANLMLINNGDGTFIDKAAELGLDNQGYGVNAAFFDYDGDGDLDVYVANQTSSRLNSSDAARMRGIVDPYAGDKLYENVEGKFMDVTVEAGLYSSKVGFAHGVSIGDINEDGWEDMFVSNDFFEYDYLYINNGDKTFTETSKQSMRHLSNFSMGNDMGDFNNDGLLDLVVLDMVAEGNRRLYANTGGNSEQTFQRVVMNGLHYQYMFNVLHMNNGNSTFSEIGMMAGISRTDWSWAPILADFDNDGFKDLFVSNGIRKDIRNIDWGIQYRNMIQFVGDFNQLKDSQMESLLKTLPYEPVPNYMFRNRGDLTFEKVIDEWGLNYPSYSNGAAYGDLDNDGDLDLVVNNVDEKAFVFENQGEHSNFIRFRFQGPGTEPMGLGTRVRIYHGDQFQYNHHYVSRGYRSSLEPVMHFGLGKDTVVSRVEVTWIDGKRSVFEKLGANQVVTLNYSDAREAEDSQVNNKKFHFEDVTGKYGISAKHSENDIIDFMNQPMLPYKISALGPAFAAGDINGDSLDDFYLGGSFRNPGQLFVQKADGTFESAQEDTWKNDRFFEDTGAAFFDIDDDGDLDLYVASGGVENTPDNQQLFDRLYLNNGSGVFIKDSTLLPEVNGVGSVVKPCDYDGDGDLDLFVGGRIQSGKYPLPPSSFLLVNEGGRMKDLSGEKSPGLIDLGMVTGACWSDYDQDGDPDLLVVGEWMPVTIFNNHEGMLTRIKNENNGLEHSAGWWWTIASTDVDMDGDDDYILGNMGRNYRLKASINEPLELFATDFDENERLDIVYGYYQEGKLYPANDRSKAVSQNSFLVTAIPTNNQYAIMALDEIYGKENLDQAYHLQIYEMSSGILINNGDRTFHFQAFDNYAQVTNMNAVVVDDIDQDGFKDLVLGGNLYTMEAETMRNDAGIGLWIKGNGKGSFISQPYPISGLYLEGDVRALSKINTAQGDAILSVTNNGPVQLILINH
jgi:hypothetical protein